MAKQITQPASDDEWQVIASEAAVAAVRELYKSGGINGRATLASLGDIEIGWIVAAAIFAWIKVRAQQAVANGINPEITIRAMAHKVPDPWQAGAIKSILPALGDIKGLDWSKPVGFWSEEEITAFAFHIHELISRAYAGRDAAAVGAIINKIGKEETERLHSAAHGGPLMSRGEVLDDSIPF